MCAVKHCCWYGSPCAHFVAPTRACSQEMWGYSIAAASVGIVHKLVRNVT